MHITQYVHKIHILKVDILIEKCGYFSTHNCLFWLIKNHVKYSKFTENSSKITKNDSKSPKIHQNMPFSVQNSTLTQNGNKNDPKRPRKRFFEKQQY